MRDLTEEELKLAPSWATHYQVTKSGNVIWESKDKYQTVIMSKPRKQNSKLSLCRPINKPFDITKHEFSDAVGFVECDGSELTLSCTGSNYVELYKDDAIAIAKALGVTGGIYCE